MSEIIGLCALFLVVGLLLGIMVCYGPNVRALRRSWQDGYATGRRSRNRGGNHG
jgi:hypothetical protein